MNEHAKQKVQEWIDQLNEQDMPVFATTVTNVSNAVNSEDTSATDVANTILKDASLTSRLLKMANSPYYNPGRHMINTITRAVMVLGFEKVRGLALSLLLIDALEDNVHRDKITEELALAFHAAVQAEGLAKMTNSQSSENIFIATLLYRLGNIVFWAFADEEAKQLQRLIDIKDRDESEAELKILGFKLKDLTQGLSQSWSLSELLDQSLNSDYQNEPRVKLVHMGHSLAQASVDGWDSEQITESIEDIAKNLGVATIKIERLAHRNAKQAQIVTHDYGVTAVSRAIPQVEEPSESIKLDKQLVDEEPIARQTTTQNCNIQAQVTVTDSDISAKLNFLQEITEAIEEKPSINVIIEMALEGIVHALKMDRAMFAVLSNDRKKLLCKYTLGSNAANINEQFKIDISQTSNIFNQVISAKTGAFIPADPKRVKGTINKVVFELLGYPPYVIMPTIVGNKVIGVFLADRNESNKNVTAEDFLSFQQFCQQANMGITFLTMQD